MQTVQEIVDRVRNQAGDVDVLQFSNATLFQWINDAAKECASNNKLLQKTGTQNSIIGTSTYPVPADILKLHSVRYNAEKVKLLTMEEFDKYIDDFQTTSTGASTTGYIWAGVLNLYPIPDSVKQIQINYTRTPVEVATTGDAIDLPVMYHRRLVDYCLAMVAEQDDDMAKYQQKMQEFSTGVSTLKDDGQWEDDLYPSITVSPRDMGDWDVDWYE